MSQTPEFTVRDDSEMAQKLRKLFRYDEETGEFIRLVTRSANAMAGAVAGSAAKNGYLRIRIDNKYYYCHRLAWLFMTGGWPACDIDHVNGVRSDNRWSNLREATRAQNLQNISGATKAESGYVGAYWHQKTGKWQSKVTRNGRSKSLGYFGSAEEAHEAYLAWRRENNDFQSELRSANG